MKDPEITAKWRAEVFEQQEQEDTPLNIRLDEPMVCILTLGRTDVHLHTGRLCVGRTGRLRGPRGSRNRDTGDTLLVINRSVLIMLLSARPI
jgi:hypothetical protein